MYIFKILFVRVFVMPCALSVRRLQHVAAFTAKLEDYLMQLQNFASELEPFRKYDNFTRTRQIVRRSLILVRSRYIK